MRVRGCVCVKESVFVWGKDDWFYNDEYYKDDDDAIDIIIIMEP